MTIALYATEAKQAFIDYIRVKYGLEVDPTTYQQHCTPSEDGTNTFSDVICMIEFDAIVNKTPHA